MNKPKNSTIPKIEANLLDLTEKCKILTETNMEMSKQISDLFFSVKVMNQLMLKLLENETDKNTHEIEKTENKSDSVSSLKTKTKIPVRALSNLLTASISSASSNRTKIPLAWKKD